MRTLLVMAAAIVLTGCNGDGLQEVSGIITVDGEPIQNGGITFIPVDPSLGPTTGGMIKEGKYEARVPAGAMKVCINAMKEVGQKKIYDTPDSPTAPILREMLPPKYSDNQKTELRFEVKPGKNEKNWDLKEKE